jgi:branched-chain amino acid transport system permease protein
MAAALGLLALRTAGVSFMIVTLMFAQAGFLTLLYFAPVTGGDDGFAVAAASRTLMGFDLSTDTPASSRRWRSFAVGLLASLVRSSAPPSAARWWRCARTRNARACLATTRSPVKLRPLPSRALRRGRRGRLCAAFRLCRRQFRDDPVFDPAHALCPSRRGGHTLGPFLGALLMFVLIEAATGLTTAHQFIVGAALVVLVLFAPKGILGTIRERWVRWLP